jgi:hypothetical protein
MTPQSDAQPVGADRCRCFPSGTLAAQPRATFPAPRVPAEKRRSTALTRDGIPRPNDGWTLPIAELRNRGAAAKV